MTELSIFVKGNIKTMTYRQDLETVVLAVLPEVVHTCPDLKPEVIGSRAVAIADSVLFNMQSKCKEEEQRLTAELEVYSTHAPPETDI